MIDIRTQARLAGALAALALLTGCAGSIDNRNPTGERFPSVVGESLAGEQVALPDALEGAPAILLIGYKQDTQFDIDRWLMGFAQARVDARILEIPTIPGLVPSMLSGWIDDGMRSGIPRDDWRIVVTLYGAAAKPVARFTGNENGNNARVIVLDGGGKVVLFEDAGYSVRRALEIVDLVASMSAREGDPQLR